MSTTKVTDLGFQMDNFLLSNLKSLAFNARKDWDFVIPITGSGKTRVGKSVLGTQVGYYLAHNLGTSFNNYNVVFSGGDLMKKALESPKNTVFVYDESRGELEGKKAIQKVHANLYDFFAECGMLNHIIILIMPDFFELQKGIAVNRSLFLLNVKYGREIREVKGERFVEFKRGVYEFYDEKKKRMLYFMGKKNYNDYTVVKGNFNGNFPDFWPIDKVEYEKNKLEFMRRNKDEEATDSANDKYKHRNALIYYLVTVFKHKYTDISKIFEGYGLELSRQMVGKLMKEFEIAPPGGNLTLTPKTTLYSPQEGKAEPQTAQKDETSNKRGVEPPKL